MTSKSTAAMAPKRLGFVSTLEGWGASEFLWSETACLGVQSGHQIWAAVSEGTVGHTRIAELHRLGAHVLSWPSSASSPSLLQRGWRRLRRLAHCDPGVRRDSPANKFWQWAFPEPLDILCINQGGAYCGLLVPGLLDWLRVSGTRYLILSHSDRWHLRTLWGCRQQAADYYQGAVSSAFVAEENRRCVMRELGIKPRGGAVLQNPLSVPDPNKLPWPAGPQLKLACVARLELMDKGQDLLLEALAEPQWRSRPVTLTLFGRGEDLTHTQNLVRFFGLQDRVTIDYATDVREVWKSHHILVLPSRSEGTPLTLFEAMLCARPSVVTAVGGNADWVEDGVTGFVAAAATVPLVNEALERAWQNAERWPQMGLAARERCLARRDPNPARTLLDLLINSI